jgi:hypothetical protein
VPSRSVKTLIVILRSACVGIAGVVVAKSLWAFAVLSRAVTSIATSPHPRPVGWGEVGIDVVTVLHNSPTSAKITVVGFAAGFGLGFRHFGRSLRHNSGKAVSGTSES